MKLKSNSTPWFSALFRVPPFSTCRVSLLLFTLFAFTCVSLHSAEISCFAAASLTDTLNEISAAYEKESRDKIVLNFAASSFLARQIEEGAPADIFFSADEAKMDALQSKGLIVKETRKNRLSNSLVVVISRDSPLQIKSARDLSQPGVKRIALADPKTVPAGIYAKQYLEKINLWSVVEPKVIPTDNVRAALAAVEAGNVDVGMVYKTDAAIAKNAKVACEVPPSDGPVINYPMALLKEARQPEAAKQFLKYLDSEPAARVFEKFGFIVRR